MICWCVYERDKKKVTALRIHGAFQRESILMKVSLVTFRLWVRCRSIKMIKILPNELNDKVFEVIGAASMCWENVDAGTGIFNSSKAKDIANELCKAPYRYGEDRVKNHVELIRGFE